MARTGYPSKYGPVLLFNPRGVSSNDWSDPNDFAAADTVRYYVDASAADDAANGLTDSTPKKTLAAVMALARAGQISVPGRPDQVLLKRGETWTDEVLGYLTTNNLNGGTAISGRSATQRFVIGTYGSGVRPRIKTGASQGPAILSGGTSPSNIAILGIDFDSYQYPAGFGSDTAIDWASGASQLLIEDCLFREEMQTPIKFGKPGGTTAQADVVIRRNVFENILGQVGSWIRLGRHQRLLIEENHFDGRNGISWVGYEFTIGAGIQDHYECLSTDIIVQGNTFSTFGTHAIYLPSGAKVRDNVIFNGGNAIQVGNRYEGVSVGFAARPGGVEVEIVGNYISDLYDVPSSFGDFYRGGRGIHVENATPGGLVYDNILTRNTGTKPWAIELFGFGTTATGVPCSISDLTLQRNKVYRFWRPNNPYHYKGVFIDGTNNAGQPPDISNIDFKNNDIQEPAAWQSLLVQIGEFSIIPEVHSARNRFWRTGITTDRYSVGGGSTNLAGYLSGMGDTNSVETQVPYPDPDKTIADYHASIGGTATVAAYVAAVRAQSRYTTGGASGWNDDLMASKVLDYMRANFSA